MLQLEIQESKEKMEEKEYYAHLYGSGTSSVTPDKDLDSVRLNCLWLTAFASLKSAQALQKHWSKVYQLSENSTLKHPLNVPQITAKYEFLYL